MARQPFERKSLWHLSAPCYHIPSSMGDNFETACTAPRTNVPAGACEDEKVSSGFQSLPVAVCLSKAPTARVKGCPGSGGHRRPSPPKRRQSGGEGAASWQGRDSGRCEQDGPCRWLAPAWSPADHPTTTGSPRVGRRH